LACPLKRDFGKADKAEEISKNSEAILQAKKLGKELSQQ